MTETIGQVDDLTLIVDDEHKDKCCERQSFSCPNEAVVELRWAGCPDAGWRRACLTCWSVFKGPQEARCSHCGTRMSLAGTRPVQRD